MWRFAFSVEVEESDTPDQLNEDAPPEGLALSDSSSFAYVTVIGWVGYRFGIHGHNFRLVGDGRRVKSRLCTAVTNRDGVYGGRVLALRSLSQWKSLAGWFHSS